ncbi:putative elongator complex protein 1, partial [Coemansia nantahalensis]
GEHGEEAQVSVGWGSAATQYHGRNTSEEEEKQSSQEASAGGAYDDGRVRISWRGDGAFVSVSFLAGAGRREIRVFTREGRLHSVSEAVDGLEHPLAWKPSGRLVASTQRRAHRHDVVFFERNGLRHGEFALRGGSAQQRVLDLAWNADSSVLAATVEESGAVHVELWADNNYHWYLKQRIGPRLAGGITHAVWHPEEPLTLFLSGTEAAIVRMELHAAAAVAQVASESSNAAAAVVDGSGILYTPFSYANVPPPMALHTLDAPLPVAHAAFAAFGDGNDFCALLADRASVACYGCSHATRVADAVPPQLQRTVQLGAGAWARQVAWPRPGLLVAVGLQLLGDGQVRQVVFVAEFGGTGEAATQAWPVAAEIVLLTAAPHTGQVLAAAADGQVYEVDLQGDGAAARLVPVARHPAPCVEIAAVRPSDDSNGAAVVVGRSARNQLFANDHVISTVCLSFYLRRDMLLFTTTTHRLRFVPVSASLAAAAPSEDDEGDASGSKFEERQRRVERGSAIVLAAPVGDAVVLQMPRGNLETIRPRALVLAAVRRMLDARRFREAVVACRVNRIDLNIVHDHAPAAFMADLPEFVRQVDDPDLLNLFATALRDEDVTKSMYAGMDGGPSESKCPGKTNAVCRALRPVLQLLDPQRYMPTMLTTLVCQSPADIPGALQLLSPLDAEARDAALTYLLYLSDVDTVYNAALGMYDLPLALVVAQRSQHDPREYLPALGKLHAIASDDYRRYKIDVQLARHDQALQNLCAAYATAKDDEAELWCELCAFVAEHGLYQSALGLLAGTPARHAEMCRLYGAHLADGKQWPQAAAAYLLAGAVPQAIDAFVRAADWRTAMALASDQAASGFSEQAVHDTAVRASAILADHHRFADAAAVLLDYAGAHEDAVALLVRGSHWAEAMRCAHLHRRADLIETTVIPGVDAALDTLLEDVEETTTSFATKVARLREVRATPLEVLAAAHVEMRAGSGEAPDNVDVMSDTASMASQFTTFTGTATNASTAMTGSTARRASKARMKKKEEKRRIRGKKGSIYEEAYLVDSVAKLIGRVRALQPSVRNLCLALIQFGRTRAAQQVHSALRRLVLLVLDDADWVFDGQRVQLQFGESGIPVPVPADTNSFGASSQPRHPKPVLPTLEWTISALV